MPTVTISDVTYQRLAAIASARKLSFDAYLNEVADREAVSSSDSVRQLQALESFAAGMTAWANQHLPPNHSVDDSRDSIYEGRGE